MCDLSHGFEYVEDVPTPGCCCIHHYKPLDYPTCICPKAGAWVCRVCGAVLHPMLMKQCMVCRRGINEPVSFSQHFHDSCATAWLKRPPLEWLKGY